MCTGHTSWRSNATVGLWARKLLKAYGENGVEHPNSTVLHGDPRTTCPYTRFAGAAAEWSAVKKETQMTGTYSVARIVAALAVCSVLLTVASQTDPGERFIVAAAVGTAHQQIALTVDAQSSGADLATDAINGRSAALSVIWVGT